MIEDKVFSQIEYKDLSAKIHDASLERDRVIKAQMELTYRCNLHCVHCYTDPYNRKEYFPRELALGEIKRILDEMADYGILWLNFTGGEVFVRKDFFEIYEYACEKGFITVLYTNGTVFTEKIMARLKKKPPFFIDVSCHSVNEDAFDRFTQVKGSFRNFMRGMDLLKASGLSYRLKTKAMNWNKDEIPEIRQFVESHGLEFSFTTAVAPRLNGDLSSLQYRLAPDEIRILEDEQNIWRDDEETCGNVRAAIADPPENLYRCGCAVNSIHINAWGELGTCTLEYESRASLREYPLAEAVQKVFSEVRAMKYESDSACRACRIFSLCEKSPTTIRQETGNRESPNPYHCDVTLARTERLTQQKLQHPLRPHCHSEPATESIAGEESRIEILLRQRSLADQDDKGEG